MGCLLSVSSNTCVNVVDLAAVGGLRDASWYRRKGTSAYSSRGSSLFSSRRRGSRGGRHTPRRPRRPGIFVADALRNLQRAHSFRHGECYLCNYKNKSCNGVCIHREIFTSVKPSYYSNYYNKGSHVGGKRGDTLRASLHALPPSRQSDVFSVDSLSRGSVLRQSLQRSGSFKAKARRSMRSITAFPPDAPPPELGIKPQVSLRLSRHSLGRRETCRSVASWEEREALAIFHDALSGGSVSGDSNHSSHDGDDNDEGDDDAYEPVLPPLPERNRRGGAGEFATPVDLIVHSVQTKGTLVASDFGLVKGEHSFASPSPPFPKSLPSNPTYSSILDPGASSDNLTDISVGSEEKESSPGQDKDKNGRERDPGCYGAGAGHSGGRPNDPLPPLPSESPRGASPVKSR